MNYCPASTDEEFKAARAEAVRLLLSSKSQWKVLVAGPGTGKTYSFGALIDRVEGKTLVISFLGNLVQDLARSLGNRARVCTFHSFCRNQLHKLDIAGITHDVDYYPPFLSIVDADLDVVLPAYAPGSLEKAYVLLDDSEGLVSRGLSIGNYYNAVGHVDSVYRVFKTYKTAPQLVPGYAQVLVDEYQDFNLLEVSLIELLTEHASAVIAGDDDQALYGFKQASSKYLRDLTKRGDFERFDLPYCSRCTSVLVDAIHRVVECAQSQGLLAERIEKPYWCYLPEKRRASERYPKIIDAHCSVENNNANYMCRYIEQQILRGVTAIDIKQSRKKGYPTVLVIAPVEFGKRVYNHLTKQGMPNVVLKTSAPCEIELLDGYLRLVDDERSRLGWRILVHLLKPAGWKKAVRKAMTDGEEFVDLLDEGFVVDQLEVVTSLRRGYEGEALPDSEIDLIEKTLGILITDVFEREDEEELEGECDLVEEAGTSEAEQPTVWITSLVGAKGLQAEHVFVAGMNDRHFPRLNSSVTEDEICMLLVALTRARQSCDLVSCGRFGGQALGRSVFLQWLSPLTQYVRVDAEYWRRASAREAEESQQS